MAEYWRMVIFLGRVRLSPNCTSRILFRYQHYFGNFFYCAEFAYENRLALFAIFPNFIFSEWICWFHNPVLVDSVSLKSYLSFNLFNSFYICYKPDAWSATSVYAHCCLGFVGCYYWSILPHLHRVFASHCIQLFSSILYRCWRLFMIKLWNHGLLDARTMNSCNIILEQPLEADMDQGPDTWYTQWQCCCCVSNKCLPYL